MNAREYQLKPSARWNPQSEEDKERAAFLHALDHSSVDVTNWEAKFLENNIGKRTFSDGQRQAIDGLIRRYGATLKW